MAVCVFIYRNQAGLVYINEHVGPSEITRHSANCVLTDLILTVLLMQSGCENYQALFSGGNSHSSYRSSVFNLKVRIGDSQQWKELFFARWAEIEGDSDT